MARYYRRRYTRVVRPKKKWASNMVIRSFNIDSESPVPFSTLVINSSAISIPTPVIIKTGNFKVNADIFVTASSSTIYSTQLMALVIYIPEGIGIANNTGLKDYITAHPEYIMGWKQFDSDILSAATTGRNEEQVTFSSRLKRNLNSGDQVAFAILDNSASEGSSSSGIAIKVKLTAQYWTCAN